MAGTGSSVADELIEHIVADSPGHEAGKRPIHAPGIAVTGWFQATAAARHYTVAEHFRGKPVPVTVRFSNGTGVLDNPDSEPTLVRGMAVKFHLGERPGLTECDMIAMALPVFFARTVAEFREFTRAAVPLPVTRTSLWRKLANQLALRVGPPDPPKGAVMSNAAGTFTFAVEHEFAAPALVGVGMLEAPASYGSCSYNAVHAFVLTDPHGARRWVRFRWEPVDGVRAAPRKTKGNYLGDELRASLALSAIEFVLRMQVGEQGDDPSDPTTAWPQRRPRVVVGHLLLHAVAPDQAQSAEAISFNPTRLVEGIDVSEDETLRIRGPVYERSAALRGAEASAAGQTMTRTSGTAGSDGA